MNLRNILEELQAGKRTVEETIEKLRLAPFSDFGYAKPDTHREIRTGFPEVIFCEGKSDTQLLGIVREAFSRDGAVFGTRASAQQAAYLQNFLPQITYDPLSRILKIESEHREEPIGAVAVCTGGTADIPVAEEAAQTAEYFGTFVHRIYDVGISGLHRLLAYVGTLQKMHCIIAAAGMEGALASVLAGLVSAPVIGLPTSVGYGASFSGLAPLLTMINSCANGVAVVNIDNGFGAGYLAAQINRLAVATPSTE